MSFSRLACRALAGAWVVVLFATACGSSERAPGPRDGGGAANSEGGGGGSSGIGGEGMGLLPPDDIGEECAGDLIEAERVPLDMYVMLDVSGSMLAPTEGDPAVNKWQAVTAALSAFVSDEASEGIGMGLQVFPIRHPDAPTSCSASQECGEFGPCFLKACRGYGDGLLACDTEEDCGQLGPCAAYGHCAKNAQYLCRDLGDSCGFDPTGADLGECVPLTSSTCAFTADCRPDTYATPVAEIAALPAASPGLLAALEAAAPDPNGLTPTGPALTGAIAQASAWAKAHVDHQVVAVLATDGLPTLCDPIDIDDVAAVAEAGRAGSPPISTFVIGVVGPGDVSAPDNLGSIAAAGGTRDAFIVDTEGDVAAQFRDALNQIRAARLACSLLVPQAEPGKPVDYDYVNVVFDDGAGPSTLKYWPDWSACDPKDGGWYFDKDPDSGQAPRRILICPSTCNKFGDLGAGSVRIRLGCLRREVVK